MADLPVITFIQERLAESVASGGVALETRKGTGFYDLFIKPQQLMLEPLLAAMETTLISQSVRRMRNLADPDSFDSVLVDDGVGNVYVDRSTGAIATTTIRVFYSEPLDKEFPALTAEFISGSLSFFNTTEILISAAQMATQQEGTLYYFDVLAEAQTEGDSYNVAIGDVTQFLNDPVAVSVTNLTAAVGGLPAETNTAVLDRARNSIGVRDLETIKGINAILREKFPALREIQAIGFGDPEMMRDILYNVHVGGNTDVYVKTPSFQSISRSFIGLGFDFTRELARNVHMELTALDYSDPASDLNTPNIVSTSVVVKDDVIETAARVKTASVPTPLGINLTGTDYIKISIDGRPAVNVKVSGATPAATQRFEIINAINATTGLSVATSSGVDRVLVQSPTVGAFSSIVFSTPDFPRTDATALLFPDAVTPSVAATVYIENVDYFVDYGNGKIKKAPFPAGAIRSGDIVAQSPGDGFGSVTAASTNFTSVVFNAFINVFVGDTLTIISSTSVAPGDYIVQTAGTIFNNYQTIKILGMAPTGIDSAVVYTITSNQVVIVDYRYFPLSIDVGNQVLLADGVTRGIRPGRSDFTISDMAFINITSIEEIDPDTGESLGTLLLPPGGFGTGGFGQGGFGRSGGGDYRLIVNEPTERFSAFEDALIVFDPSLFGKSYKITFNAATEIVGIHNVSRNDLERVTGADVLPKNFIPGFVDMTVGIRRDLTNTATPDNAALALQVANLIHSTAPAAGLRESDIIQLLENAGVDSVQTPFDMKVTVLNPDGSTVIYVSQDILTVPTVVLPKQTDVFTTPRIVHMYPQVVSVVEV